MKKSFTRIRRLFSNQVATSWWHRLSVAFVISISLPALSLAQTKIWDKTIGGDGDDYLKFHQQTRDGGYILGGSSNSGKSGDKSQGNKSEYPSSSDFWIVKLNADGTKAWDKTIGSDDSDEFTSLQQTSDGGYILGGYTWANKSYDKSEDSRGSFDYWIVKLKPNGTKEWDKTFGGTREDKLQSVQQTTDGGYILGGSSNSRKGGDKSEINRGTAESDFWIVKLKPDGTKVWDKTIGGSGSDELQSLQQTPDGGYLLGGSSRSGISGDKSEANRGVSDYWVVKLKADGSKVWDKTLGGTGEDYLTSFQATSDGGFIVAGSSESDKSGDKTGKRHDTEYDFDLVFPSDFWVVKLNANGSKVWDKTIGGNKYDGLSAVLQTKDGDILLGGYSLSDASGEKTESNIGSTDYWLVKIKADGSKLWDKTIGGNGNDILQSVQQATDGTYTLGGTSSSNLSGDKSQNAKGENDYWLVKLDNNITYKKEQNITFSPIVNQDYPFTQSLTLKASSNSGLPISFHVVSGPAKVKGNQLTLTGTGTVTVQATQEGNNIYDAARPFTQIFNVINSPLIKLWDRTYGGVITKKGSDYTYGNSNFAAMVATPDGGYLLGGTSDSRKGNDKSQDHYGILSGSTGDQIKDYWVVRVDANGRKIWDKTIGGDQWDQLRDMIATPDGGYLLGGSSKSGKSGDKSETKIGGYDYWLVKLDAYGNKVWDKTLGGKGYDNLAKLVATSDGGYLIGDYNYKVTKIDAHGKEIWQKSFPISFSGQQSLRAMIATPDGGYLLGGEAVNYQPEPGDDRMYDNYRVVKLDAEGNKEWDKIYGGNSYDNLFALVPSPEGGYLLGGSSMSEVSGDKTEASKGRSDFWVVKVDAQGNKLWDKIYGGSESEHISVMATTPDGNYLLVGPSYSSANGDKTEESRGSNDYWLVKIDPSGRKIWDKTYGSLDSDEQLKTLLVGLDGSYVLGSTGRSMAGGDKSESVKGYYEDYWIIKVKEKDPQVTSTWNMRYGGTGTDNFTTVIKTSDGGYLSGGYTNSGKSGDKSQASQDKNDYWIVKSDKNGKKLWDKRYGGTGDDFLNSVIQTIDGGYLLAGSSLSGKSGDKSQVSRGDRDYWIVKVDAKGTKQWDQRYGGSGYDELKHVYQLSSGRYILAGTSNSPAGGDKRLGSQGGQDYWVLKISVTGERIWDKRYGGSGNDVLEGLAPTLDSGFLLGGTSASGVSGDKTQASRGNTDFWLVRIDADGNPVWNKRFGGTGEDQLLALGSTGTSSGNFFVAGTSTSGQSGDKSQNSQGGKDYWMLKINSKGGKLWDKGFGGNQDEELRSIILTQDGGYMLAGSSVSGKSGDKSQTSQGKKDYWLVKTNDKGEPQWNKQLGGSGQEELRTVLELPEGGYVAGGRSDSGVSGDRSQPSQGGTDYWLVKVAPITSSTVVSQEATQPAAANELNNLQLQAYPNPFSERVTINFTLPETQQASVKVYDGQGNEVATLFNREAKANQEYQVEWKAGNKPAGLYFLQLQTPTKKHQQKLLLTR